MRIESNYSHPHGMRIRVIRIESGLHESTSTGGMNTNWLRIGMLRHNIAAREGLDTFARDLCKQHRIEIQKRSV